MGVHPVQERERPLWACDQGSKEGKVVTRREGIFPSCLLWKGVGRQHPEERVQSPSLLQMWFKEGFNYLGGPGNGLGGLET